MNKGETSWLFPNTSSSDSSHLSRNHTEVMNPIYVFTPAGDTAKRVLCSILSAIGALGFLGNCLLFYYLWKKKITSPIQKSRFVKNLNLYIRSLSLSDLLSCAVSLPLLCVQILFDVFQSGWPCKIVRYLNFLFPAITINNLVVISLEKYLSTRKIPHTFSANTVRKMIITAWVLGVTIMLLPASTYEGIRVDLNDTHFTVICRYKDNFYPVKLSLIIFPLQYVIPGIFITFVHVSLLKTLWNRAQRKIDHTSSSAFKAKLTATRIKGTYLLVALTFAFIIPYSCYIGNFIYSQIAKPRRSFSTDFILRYGAGGIAAYFSSAINFIIYFVQMKDFRVFVQNSLRCNRIYAERESNQSVAISTPRKNESPRTQKIECRRAINDVENIQLSVN